MTQRVKRHAVVVAFAGALGTAAWQTIQARYLHATVTAHHEKEADEAKVFFALLERTDAERQAAMTCLELDALESRRVCLAGVFQR